MTDNRYTQAQRELEDKIADELGKIYDRQFHRPLKPFSRYDFIVCRKKKVVAFAEFKDRTSKSSTKFDTYMTGMDKWTFLLELSQSTGLPCFLYVKFSDGLFRVKITKSNYLIEYDPKWNQYRGDQTDIEPSIHVPIAHFNKISMLPPAAQINSVNFPNNIELCAENLVAANKKTTPFGSESSSIAVSPSDQNCW